MACIVTRGPMAIFRFKGFLNPRPCKDTQPNLGEKRWWTGRDLEMVYSRELLTIIRDLRFTRPKNAKSKCIAVNMPPSGTDECTTKLPSTHFLIYKHSRSAHPEINTSTPMSGNEGPRLRSKINHSPTSNTHPAHEHPSLLPTQLAQARHDLPHTSRSQWVSEGDGAAVRVYFGNGEGELIQRVYVPSK